MQFSKSIVLPDEPDRVWSQVSDLGVLADCLPGARLASIEAGTARGSLAVRVGRILADFDGVAEILSQDEEARSIVIKGEGSGSQGRAQATISAQVVSGDGGSRLDLDLEIEIIGILARLGRGMADPVVERLIDRFAANLAERLGSPAAAVQAPPGDTQVSHTASDETEDVFDMSSVLLESPVVRLVLAVLAGVSIAIIARRALAQRSHPPVVNHFHLSLEPAVDASGVERHLPASG